MNTSTRYSFAFKISTCMITCVVIVFIGVLFYNYVVSKKLVIKNIFENAKNSANLMSDRVGLSLSTAEKVSENMASFIEFSNQTESGLLSMLRSVVQNHDSIYGSGAAFEPYKFDKNKYYFAPYFYKSDDGVKLEDATEYNYFEKDWYSAPKKMGHGIWTEPYFDEGDGVYMVTYSQPIYKNTNGKREFCGVIISDVALDWLEDMILGIDDHGYESDYAFVLSSKGKCVAHPNKEYYTKGKSFLDFTVDEGKHSARELVAENMIAGKTGFARYMSSHTRKMSYIFYQPLWRTGWSLGIVIPEAELFSDLNTVTLHLFIIGLMGYVLTMFLMVILARRMTKPLRILAGATHGVGEGDFNVKLPVISSSDEIGLLSHSFCVMQKNLAKYIDSLKKTTAAKEKIEKELSIAYEIQQSFLPRKFPHLMQIDVYAILIPSKEVGGSFYDFFFMDEKHLCFATGDASGKGVPAALFMAVAKTLLRAIMGVTRDPARVLNAMNRDLCRENETCMFITFFLGVLNIETGRLEYCNAGHVPPLIHTANRGFYHFYTKGTCLPLGSVPDANYVRDGFTLLPEDVLFLYTDGVVEAENNENVQFSESKLIDLLNKNKNERVENIVNNIKAAVEQHISGTVQSDDITMLVFKYKGVKNNI